MKKAFAALLVACLLFCAACTPTPTPSPTTTPTQTPPPAIPQDPAVKTDWSKLTPYEPEEALYTHRYPEFTDTLIPTDDYGPLIPFLGDKLGGLSGSADRYGLVTLKGEVVVDPVFSDVWRGDSSWGYHNASPLPYMMLGKGVSTSSRDEYPKGGGWAMAALDGSWCTEFKYTMDSELTIWGRGINGNATEDGIFMLDGNALVYLDGATGKEKLRVEGLPADNRYDALFSARWDGSGAVYQYYVYAKQGTEDYCQTYRTDASGTARLTGWQAERAMLTFVDGKAVRSPDTGGTEVVDVEGNVLLRSDYWLDYHADADGGVYVETQNVHDETGGGDVGILNLYTADTLKRVENSPLTGRRVRNVSSGDMWYWCREGENVLFFRGNEVYTLVWPVGTCDTLWGRVALFRGEQGSSIVTLDGTVLARDLPSNDIAVLHDRVTGDAYLRVREGRSLRFYGKDGVLRHTFPAAPAESGILANGALLVTGADSSGLRNEAGEWLFRYPLPVGEWD